MYKTTLKIDGMACSMCENHVCDAIRNKLPVKKVTASHKKGEATLLSDQPIEEQDIAAALSGTGYDLLSVAAEPYEKKSLLGSGRSNALPGFHRATEGGVQGVWG